MNELKRLQFKFRIVLTLFMIGLILSGLTAFPLVWELTILNRLIGSGTWMQDAFPAMAAWITTIHDGLIEVQAEQPWLYYGTDWLAFAHIFIASAFIGPLRDPVRNKWVIDFGLITCAGIFALAFICGPLRGIPFFWQLIDCSFGIVGAIPLLLCRRWINQMEGLT
ncbi:MAG: hypothetical protein LLF76_14440 [Planctomycetaceae bacterium]|nr:hypothetical protein [Planctomycetaceae bacterium]